MPDVQVLLDDCRDVLRSLPTSSIDLTDDLRTYQVTRKEEKGQARGSRSCDEAITAATSALGVNDVSRAIDHRSVKTTERFCILDKVKLEQKRAVANAIARAFPMT